MKFKVTAIVCRIGYPDDCTSFSGYRLWEKVVRDVDANFAEDITVKDVENQLDFDSVQYTFITNIERFRIPLVDAVASALNGHNVPVATYRRIMEIIDELSKGTPTDRAS